MSKLRVLVPLDGSEPAEAALGYLEYIRPLGELKVTLLGVWEKFISEPVDGDQDEAKGSEADLSGLTRYLDRKAVRLKGKGIHAVPLARMGLPASQILREADVYNADLIVISTHGRSGFSRWRLGSVADKVIRGASCPVLVIGPVAAERGPERLESILVPLDGSELAESALPVAACLAQATGARIELVSVTTDKERSGEYLREVWDRVGAGVEARTALLAGDIAEAIVSHVKRSSIQIVVMTSHGRGGFVRWVLGSVTEQLLQAPAPVLVLPASGRPVRLPAGANAPAAAGIG